MRWPRRRVRMFDLALQDGDILVLQTTEELTDQQLAAAHEAAEQSFGPPVILLACGIHVRGVIRKAMK